MRVKASQPGGGTRAAQLQVELADPFKPGEAFVAPLVENIMFPKRLGRPDEFALLVESIARNPYLNGENIRLDGALRFPPK